MHSRRQFLGALSLPAALPMRALALEPSGLLRVAATFAPLAQQKSAEVARDERAWFEVQQAFTCDRSTVNLNNGGVCASPRVTQEAMKRHLDFSNQLPSHNLWQVQEPQKESVRTGLARLFGCDPEELAITRNASESLQICQLGFDLARGDEVLTTAQDYPRMLTTFEQRARRDGVVVSKLSLPVPCEALELIAQRFEAAMNERTRLILICQVINLTGQLMPVRRIVQAARKRGIPVIVDGAHAFANLAFRQGDIDCDYYGTSLHKWLFAPHGTGMLFVRRDKIRGLWPLMGAPEKLDGDIRKFEEIGTHPAANFLAIGESLTFHAAIGAANKEARLRYLREYWVERLRASDRMRLNTSMRPDCAGTQANVRFEGLDTVQLCEWLWSEHHIVTVAIQHEEVDGLRISPSVHNTLEELDRFCDAIETALEKGLPA